MSICRTCQQEITWERRGEKNHALDADGGNHWAHCAGRSRKNKKHTGPLTIKGETITGKHYRPSCGRCDLPPWESCACSALLPMDATMRTDDIGERFDAEAQRRLGLALESEK